MNRIYIQKITPNHSVKIVIRQIIKRNTVYRFVDIVLVLVPALLYNGIVFKIIFYRFAQNNST